MAASMTITNQHPLRPSRGVRASISSDGLVLLDVDGGLVLSSNPVGARIWQLLEQERTLPEIAQQLVEEYKVPGDRARRDVEAFIAALSARNLLARDARS